MTIFIFSLLFNTPTFSAGNVLNKCEECVVAHYNCKMKFTNQDELMRDKPNIGGEKNKSKLSQSNDCKIQYDICRKTNGC